MALGAKIKLASAKGTREMDAAKFFVAPRNPDEREIAMRPDEILAEIMVPAGAISQRYLRSSPEGGARLASGSRIGGASNARRHSVSAARVVLGHVAPTPWEAPGAEQALVGKTVTAGTAEAAGKAAVDGAQPLSQNAYKVQLAAVAVKRALMDAAKARA